MSGCSRFFFLPKDVEDGKHMNKGIMQAAADGLLNYFDMTYVSGSYRRVNRANGIVSLRQTSPNYPLLMWNVHSATVKGGHRTSHFLEVWKWRLGSIVGHSDPTVWKAIDALGMLEARA